MTFAPARAPSPEPPLREKTDEKAMGAAMARTAVGPLEVSGVLVVHDGAPWLTECLDALAQQTRPVDRLVIVDSGSTDDSLQIVAGHSRIRQAVGDVATISAPRGSTFGQAVGWAVERLPRAPTGAPWPCLKWLWLLHDDSAAAPQTLARLLDAARRSPTVGVAGPKLTTWHDPSRLIEVGSAVTRSGRRVGGPAADEPDQGQYDHRSDVLGVSTSGMLIRRDVFDTLGGFDPAFGQFRDDLDLCWRAQLSGHRVVVAPRASMREAAASTNGQRFPDLSAPAARARDRRHGRQVALARCSPYTAPLLALWIALVGLGSAFLLLVAKRPRQAWAALGDLAALMTPWRPLAARWRARGIARVRRRDLRVLFASPLDGFGHTLDMIHAAVAVGPARSAGEGAGSAGSLETGPASEDVEPLEGPARSPGSRILLHPGFLAVIVGAGLAAAAWRSLLWALGPSSGQGLAGGELLPVSADASGLWHTWLDGWHGAGLGTAGQSAPFLPVLSAGAWVLQHLPLIDAPQSSVSVFVAWLLAGAIPASAWTAYLGARVVTTARWPRAWAALAWGSLATLTTAVASGRVGAVVAHTLLPLVAAGFACAARRPAGNHATFGAALALGVVAAFNPALGAFGALAALALLVIGHGTTRLRAAVLLLVPVGLLGPWIGQLVDRPLLLLAGPGLTVWRGASTAPWQLGLLHPAGPGGYPALLSAPVVLAGVVAMARREEHSPAMSVLAVLTVAGLGLGLASPHVIIGLVPQGAAGTGSAITVWAGTGLDVAALALIAAALRGLGGLWHCGLRWRRILLAPVLVAAVLGVAASTVMAGLSGAGNALAPNVPGLPAVAPDQAAGPSGSRTLVMTSHAGTIGYRLVGSEAGPVVRDLPGPPVRPDPLLAAAVRSTVTTDGATSARDELSDLGVAFVALHGAPTQALVTRLDSTAGLTRLSDASGVILWRVLPSQNGMSPSRLRLLAAGGAPLGSIPVTGDNGRTSVSLSPAAPGAPTGGRRLVVAEPALWAQHARVTFSGRPLAAVAGAVQPTYLVPAHGGRLSITLPPTSPWWRWGQLGLLLAAVYLAVPSGSTRPAKSPRTS